MFQRLYKSFDERVRERGEGFERERRAYVTALTRADVGFEEDEEEEDSFSNNNWNRNKKDRKRKYPKGGE